MPIRDCFLGKLNSQVTVGNRTGSGLLNLAGWVWAVAFAPEAQWKQLFWWAFINLLQRQELFKANISTNVTNMWHCGAEPIRKDKEANNRAKNNTDLQWKQVHFVLFVFRTSFRSVAIRTFEQGWQQNWIFWTRTENQALFKQGSPTHGSRSWLFIFSLSGARIYSWKTYRESSCEMVKSRIWKRGTDWNVKLILLSRGFSCVWNRHVYIHVEKQNPCL